MATRPRTDFLGAFYADDVSPTPSKTVQYYLTRTYFLYGMILTLQGLF
jgi:hypothetical protein